MPAAWAMTKSRRCWAFFTAHFSDPDRQAQYLAYSHDRGRTWSLYDGNPVIDRELDHHRDPNVF